METAPGHTERAPARTTHSKNAALIDHIKPTSIDRPLKDAETAWQLASKRLIPIHEKYRD